MIHWGIEGAQVTGPIVTPGKYRVRITINGQPVTKSLDVYKDPSIAATDADLRESTAVPIRIRDDMTASAEMVNQIEIARKEIEYQLKANAGRTDAEKALHAIDQKLLDVELQLVSKTEMYSDDKWYVEPRRVNRGA